MNEVFCCWTNKMNIEDFYKNCILIVSKLGKYNNYWDKISKMSCVIPYKDETITYVDDKVAITSATTSKAFLVKKLDNNNPVLCIHEDGEMYRIHGEYTYLTDHVESLKSKC